MLLRLQRFVVVMPVSRCSFQVGIGVGRVAWWLAVWAARCERLDETSLSVPDCQEALKRLLTDRAAFRRVVNRLNEK